MRERRGPPSTPVFDRSVRVEHFRALIRPIARLQAAAGTIDIDLLDIRKRKPRRPEHIAVSGCRNRSLNEPRAAPGDVDPDRIEHAAIALVGVESVVEELTEKASGLRVAEP